MSRSRASHARTRSTSARVSSTSRPSRVQRGRVARLLFRTDDLDDLDLVDLKVGKDSQFSAAADVPLGLFPEGLDVSCELEAWQALSFRLRNRGAPRKLSIDVDVTPPTRTQE